jgi:hypothetical protein
MNRKSVFSVILLFLFTLSSFAQAIRIDAEIRSRGEWRNGFREPLADTLSAPFLNVLRSKLNFSYASKDLKAKLSLLDSRVYGSTAYNSPANSPGLYEAWGEYSFTPAFSFVIGRQALDYDDKRLFSSSNWANIQSAHDLLLLKYVSEDFSLHFGNAWNNSSESSYFPDAYTISYKSLNYLWMSRSFGKVSASAIYVNDRYETGTVPAIQTTFRNTAGINAGFSSRENPFSFHATAYYQFGRDRENRKLKASLLAVKFQYQLSGEWSVLAGGDRFSGSRSDIAAGKSNTFNKLYGSNHSFNGSIEYWRNTPKQGLVDLYAGINGNLSDKFTFNATFHRFAAQQKIAPERGRALGAEWDITAGYMISKQFSLQGGWSAYFTNEGTEFLKQQAGVSTRFPQWAYVQVTFSPVFFTKE